MYCKTIFEYIEQKYNVNFLTGGSQAIGNIWDDVIATRLYIPVRDIVVRHKRNELGEVTGFYFDYDYDTKFLPLDKVQDRFSFAFLLRG